MINRVIRFSLENRFFVLTLALAICGYGVHVLTTLPVDVLPDLNRPVVTIFTEAHGLAPEEVETQVTIPIETAINGATGVQRVRSASSTGISIVWVEFDWGSDIFIDRQIVNEKLQQAIPFLPDDTRPSLGPISSIMGEIMLIGVTSEAEKVSPMELRTLADWTLRPRLLALKGVSQVTVIGGEAKQFHVSLDPVSMLAHDLSLDDVKGSIEEGNKNTTGGVWIEDYRELLVRNLGRIGSLEDLRKTVVLRDTAGGARKPLELGQVAEVALRGPLGKRGDAGINGRPAVILSLQKQPNSDTISLTERIESELKSLEGALPKGVKVHTDLFRQSEFIRSSVHNVNVALRDGAILVTIVLFLFLLNFRTTFITLTAIPISIIITLIVFQIFGLSINTMTLGGLAIAIGELVDDAIVDVENVFRRLRENRLLPTPRAALEVVYDASTEIRNSIVFATLIVILVFLPLFALSGIEGRIFSPLGVAYVTSILASLVVAVTITPALCYFLLPRLVERTKESGEGRLVRGLKHAHAKALGVAFAWSKPLLAGTLALFLGSLFLFTRVGREFLPPFTEGALTLSVLLPPGTSLDESTRIASAAERELLKVPEISLTGRRTGRAELDEHAEGVHSSEIDVHVNFDDRSRDEVLSDIRAALARVPGIVVNVGQPISHRIDHLLSGVRAQVAIKLYGPDLGVLRQKASEIERVAKTVPGIVDLQSEKQSLIPQEHIQVDRGRAALHGVRSGALAEYVETALNGATVTQVLEGQRRFDVVVRLGDKFRNDVRNVGLLPVRSADGSLIPLSSVVSFEEAKGPNIIVREDASRRISVFANVADRDLVSAVNELKEVVAREVELPEGYFLAYEGQFQSQASASRLIMILGAVAIAGIFVVLFVHFRDYSIALQIMLSIPFAFIGAFVAVYLSGQAFSIASLVGLITLTGIASRNGIMMLDHFLHLVREEGEAMDLKMIYRGSAERLVPVLMTALTAMLALIPIALSPNEPGREILHPVAIVIVGGLLSGTLLNLLITPVVFWLVSTRKEPRESSPRVPA